MAVRAIACKVNYNTDGMMKKWEYKMVELDLMANQKNLDLVQLGDEGWEMCAATPFWEAMKVHFFFKRPKQ